jgi:hypothetical protein
MSLFVEQSYKFQKNKVDNGNSSQIHILAT